VDGPFVAYCSGDMCIRANPLQQFPPSSAAVASVSALPVLSGSGRQRPAVSLTRDLLHVYASCNPTFRYDASRISRRCLTTPSEPRGNDGLDNEHGDCILRVNDLIEDGGEGDGRRVAYRVLGLLGQGTFGQVVKAEDTSSGQLVVSLGTGRGRRGREGWVRLTPLTQHKRPTPHAPRFTAGAQSGEEQAGVHAAVPDGGADPRRLGPAAWARSAAHRQHPGPLHLPEPPLPGVRAPFRQPVRSAPTALMLFPPPDHINYTPTDRSPVVSCTQLQGRPDPLRCHCCLASTVASSPPQSHHHLTTTAAAVVAATICCGRRNSAASPSAAYACFARSYLTLWQPWKMPMYDRMELHPSPEPPSPSSPLSPRLSPPPPPPPPLPLRMNVSILHCLGLEVFVCPSPHVTVPWPCAAIQFMDSHCFQGPTTPVFTVALTSL